MKEQVFNDKEIVWFYGIVLGILALTFILVLANRAWLMSLFPALSIVGISYVGWPLKARVVDDNTIVFIGLLRRVKFTPESIASVGIVGTYDYRAQLRIRNHHDIQIGYRCRQYEQAAVLAQAFLDILTKAPNARVQPDALRLLRQVASGKKEPLPNE